MRPDASCWVGVYDNEDAVIAAARGAREQGLEIVDAFTPYAVHGLDEAMGLRKTRLGIVCFLLGVLGFSAALGFQLWTHAVDWPMNIGGKSFTALPALGPVTFEVVVLFAAIGTVLVFLARARLRPGRAAVIPADGVTDDRFVLVLRDAPGQEGSAREFLEESGAQGVRKSGEVKA